MLASPELLASENEISVPSSNVTEAVGGVVLLSITAFTVSVCPLLKVRVNVLYVA